MRAAVVVAVIAALLGSGCSGASDDAASPSSPTTGSAVRQSPQREVLIAIERGAPPLTGWFRGAVISPADGSASIRLDLRNGERSRLVVAYRGGYLAAMTRRGERGMTAVVFDAQGDRVRRLDGCLSGPVSSPDGDLVAWISRACGGSGERTLWVGPSEDSDQPDRSMTLPTWDVPARPSAVGDWGVSVQLDDGIRGYPTEVYVADPSTGEVRRVPGTTELVAVSSAGVACCVRSSLVDLETGSVVGRASAIEAFSPDSTQGIVSRGAGRRVDVIDIRTGEVLRSVTLPPRVDVGSVRWEDSRNLLFEVGRYDAQGGAYYSTILRATPSGGVERVTGVSTGDPHLL